MTTTNPPRLSLCAILGNEEAVIDRWLASMRPLMDELCVVRAVGSQTPDATLDKVRAFCAEHSIPLREGEYRNATEAKDWPHVDNFGAARQQAWELATGDWQIWCDADDVLDPRAPSLIRDAIASDKADWYECIYDVRNMGRRVPREKLVRRGWSYWRNPIHETLHPTPGRTSIRLSRIEAIFIHAPLVDKGGSRARNLRITSTMADRSDEWFFRGWDLQLDGNYDEARRCFRAALVLDRCPAKRWASMLHLAELATTTAERHDWLQQAISLEPMRREAHGLLAESLLDAGNLAAAEAFATTCAALPKGPDHWSTIPAWQTHRHTEVLRRAWRAIGRVADADNAEVQQFERHGATISLLHATRGRPEKAIATRRRWIDAAQLPLAVEHIFAIDADDVESLAKLKSYRHIVTPKGTGAGGCVAAWNAAAVASRGKVLVQLSDDWEPCQHWDAAIVTSIGDLDKPAVLAVGDGARSDGLLCMAILTRARLAQQGGSLFAPDYFGVFSDNEFTHRAHRDGVVIDARQRISFLHLHPAFGKGTMDATYERQNDLRRYREGHAIFCQRNPDAPRPPTPDELIAQAARSDDALEPVKLPQPSAVTWSAIPTPDYLIEGTVDWKRINAPGQL